MKEDCDNMERKEILLEKLFKSESDEQDLIELLDLIRVSKDESDEEIMQKLWIEFKRYPNLKNDHSDAIFNQVLSKINIRQNNSTSSVITMNRPRRRWMSQVAAAIAIIFCGVSFWNWESTHENVVISTSFAETKVIQLPDGSNVELNANSEISYQPNWCRTCDRQVTLIGEAFFEVAKKKRTNQKFQVITTDLTVEVLGTSFNVNTLHDQTEVFLEEGKVKLDLKNEEEMLMVPGDVVTYSLQTKKREKEHFRKDESIVWRDGFTSMKNISLFRILQKVEDIYGEKFVVTKDGYKNRKYTIGIPVNNFETTLTVLKEVTKLNIIQNENQYRVE